MNKHIKDDMVKQRGVYHDKVVQLLNCGDVVAGYTQKRRKRDGNFFSRRVRVKKKVEATTNKVEGSIYTNNMPLERRQEKTSTVPLFNTKMYMFSRNRTYNLQLRSLFFYPIDL
jgi:hypothetical protein